MRAVKETVNLKAEGFPLSKYANKGRKRKEMCS